MCYVYFRYSKRRESDYKVEYTDNGQLGESEVSRNATATVTGINNYTGTKKLSFSIVKPASRKQNTTFKNFSGVTFAYEKMAYTYDGKPQMPKVTATAKGGKAIPTEGTDYKVTYTDNTDAGNGVITIVGVGNYAGTKIFLRI